MNKEILLKCMRELKYEDYMGYIGKSVEVKKFWCALSELWDIDIFEEIFDFIADNSPIENGKHVFHNRVEYCEKLSLKFLNYIRANKRLLRNE